MTGEARPAKKWVLANKIPPEIDQAFGEYPAPFRQVLFNRGFTSLESARIYLAASEPIYDPLLLIGMQKTADRLAHAIRGCQRIAIYGDYDVDGVTATVLMVEVIRALGGTVEEYIPDRFEEGYGLNCDALDKLNGDGVQVVVTVDCGIRSPTEAQHARQLGIDLIISDHHHPRGSLPEAFSVVCPKQEADPYPNKDISGVGLAYKIAEALIRNFPDSGLNSEKWLDLVALGTVADVVPLTGENRVLVRKGLEVIHAGNRLGLVTLANISGVRVDLINAGDIGFKLGPRLNAAGRLENARASFQLLAATDTREAGKLASDLDGLNTRRQKETSDSLVVAEQIARTSGSGAIYFAGYEQFNEGIVGLIASKLTEAHYRPSIAARIQEETTRASCRSIPEFHITEALDECADYLVRHGGHAMAAGFTVRNDRLEEFLEKLFSIAEQKLGGLALVPMLKIDCEVLLRYLNRDLLPYLDLLNPTGAQNPGAVFLSRGLTMLEARRIGADGKHLRMRVKQDGPAMNAIAFGFGDWVDRSMEKIDLAYRLELNEYNGFSSLQLNVVDIRSSSA